MLRHYFLVIFKTIILNLTIDYGTGDWGLGTGDWGLGIGSQV